MKSLPFSISLSLHSLNFDTYSCLFSLSGYHDFSTLALAFCYFDSGCDNPFTVNEYVIMTIPKDALLKNFDKDNSL